MSKIKHFTNCNGVFQGGGCRAIALAGAYDEVYRSGLRFSEIAGTSAGSIIAALIGAGATPQQVIKAIKEIDYSEFTPAPDASDFKPGFIMSLVRFFRIPWLSTKAKFMVNLASKGGQHSSAKIENWLDKQLNALLPEIKGKVTFRDLKIPIHVVAGDIVNSKAKVWNLDKTPDDSVSLAVRCSSSIPVFYQPVQSGDNYYVDGGVLSNLPLFTSIYLFDKKRNQDFGILFIK